MHVEAIQHPNHTLIKVEEETGLPNKQVAHNPKVICACPFAGGCRHVKTGQLVDKVENFAMTYHDGVVHTFIRFLIALGCTSQDPYPGRDNISTITFANIDVSVIPDINPLRNPVQISHVADRIVVGRSIKKRTK